MALLTDDERFENESNERDNAWKKLRLIPEYIEDYNNIKNNDVQEDSPEGQRIKKTWGFWPLEDPQLENGNFEFLNYFSSYSDEVNRLNSPIDCNGFDLFTAKNGFLFDPAGRCCGKINEIPPIVELKIDLSAPLNVLKEEFAQKIKDFQNMFNISKTRTKKHNHIDYLISCLKTLNLQDKEIVYRLLSEDNRKQNCLNQNRKDEEQKIRNRLKQFSK